MKERKKGRKAERGREMESAMAKRRAMLAGIGQPHLAQIMQHLVSERQRSAAAQYLSHQFVAESAAHMQRPTDPIRTSLLRSATTTMKPSNRRPDTQRATTPYCGAMSPLRRCRYSSAKSCRTAPPHHSSAIARYDRRHRCDGTR